MRDIEPTTALLIMSIQAGKAKAFLKGIPMDVRPLWAQRYQDPFELDERAEALRPKASDPCALAAVVVDSINGVLRDTEEHGEYGEYAGSERALKKLATKWAKRAKAPRGQKDPAAVEIEALLQSRDSGVLGMGFALLDCAAHLTPREKKVAKTPWPKLPEVLTKLAKTPQVSPLLTEVMACTVARSLGSIADNGRKSGIALGHRTLAAFEVFCDAHGLPPFFGQHAVATAARLISQTLHKPSDAIVQRLLPKTEPGQALALNLAKLHARMKRKPQTVNAVRLARQFGAEWSDFGWQLEPYRRKDPALAALMGLGPRR